MRLSKRRATIFGLQVGSVAILILVWQLLVQLKIVSTFLLSPPSTVLPNIWSLLTYSSGTAYGGGFINVPGGFEDTLVVVAIAVVLVVIIGTLLGIVIGSVKFLHNVLEEYVMAVYSLPKITLIPLFWLLFGVSLAYKLSFGVVNGIFPLIIVVVYAAGSVDPALMKMANSIGASRRERIFKIFFPSIVPSLMSGVRIGFITTFNAVITAEMFVGEHGIGFLVAHFTNVFQTNELYGVVLGVIAVSVAANLSLLGLEKYLTRWKVA